MKKLVISTTIIALFAALETKLFFKKNKTDKYLKCFDILYLILDRFMRVSTHLFSVRGLYVITRWLKSPQGMKKMPQTHFKITPLNFGAFFIFQFYFSKFRFFTVQVRF